MTKLIGTPQKNKLIILMGNKMTEETTPLKTEETKPLNIEVLLIKALFRLLKPNQGVLVDNEEGNKFVVYKQQIDNTLSMQLKVAEGKEAELELGTLVHYYDTPEAAMAAAEEVGDAFIIDSSEAIH